MLKVFLLLSLMITVAYTNTACTTDANCNPNQGYSNCNGGICIVSCNSDSACSGKGSNFFCVSNVCQYRCPSSGNADCTVP